MANAFRAVEVDVGDRYSRMVRSAFLLNVRSKCDAFYLIYNFTWGWGFTHVGSFYHGSAPAFGVNSYALPCVNVEEKKLNKKSQGSREDTSVLRSLSKFNHGASSRYVRETCIQADASTC
jgi:hypothetical protein